MTARSNNNVAKTLSRLVHSDYFDTYSPKLLVEDGWIPLIVEHQKKCQHIKCLKGLPF